MGEGFPLEHIPDAVRRIAAQLADAGHEAWYVGGAVRDVLLHRHLGGPLHAGDFDIATSARPEQVMALFRRTVPVGVEHGTVAVLDAEGGAHEVTTFRRDVRTDGRHAVVEFGVSLDDDLARRDYTINAAAVHPATGDLRDPFGARADLSARLVRAVGDPAQRLREDRLRVLRGLRFAATLGFAVEPATWSAIREAAADLEHLSRERVRDEWMKTMRREPGAGVRLWREAGVLARVWPELESLASAHDAALDGVRPREPVLVTAAALHHAGAAPAAAESAARRLRFSNHDGERVRAAVAGWRDALPDASDERALRYWLSRHRTAWQDVLAGLEPESRRGAVAAAIGTVLASHAPLSVGDLAVSGDDLLAAGIAPGPAVGATLRRLLEATLDEPARNTREQLLALAKGSA